LGCSRGMAAPNAHTKLRLFADSGGYCQNPSCPFALFEEIDSKEFHLAEMAHIVAASDDGPRADTSLSEAERGAYENLILLCPTCHTRIDKAPDAFPTAMVLQWKRDHKQRIADLFGVREYPARAQARAVIEPLLVENRAIFDLYGPHNEDSQFNPESDLPPHWKRKLLAKVIPNNRRLLRIVDANRVHLTHEERQTFELFRQHVDDLEARHLGEPRLSSGIQFPPAMEHLLGEV
jgi:hypothetical protein